MHDRAQQRMRLIMQDFMRHSKAGHRNQAKLSFEKIVRASFLSLDSTQSAFDSLGHLQSDYPEAFELLSRQFRLAQISEELAYYLKKSDATKHPIDFEREVKLVHMLREMLESKKGKYIPVQVSRLAARETDIKSYIAFSKKNTDKQKRKKHCESVFSHNTFSSQKIIRKEIFGKDKVKSKKDPDFERLISIFSTEKRIFFWRKKVHAFNIKNYFKEIDALLDKAVAHERKLFPDLEITEKERVGVLVDYLTRLFAGKTNRELRELRDSISNGPASDFFSAVGFYRSNSEEFRSVHNFAYQGASIGKFFGDVFEKSNVFHNALVYELTSRGLFKGDSLYKEIHQESAVSASHRDYFRRLAEEKEIKEVRERGWTPIHL